MNLFHREYGSGYPIVILHGLYGSSDNWMSIAGKLSDSYRVILPDQRNHGRSAHNELHTYEAMSNDLHELVERLGVKKFILVGHSMGGKTASFFAKKWPGMLSGLVVIDIKPFAYSPGQGGAGEMHRAILEKMAGTDPALIKDRDEAHRIFNDIVSSKKVRNFLLKNLHRTKRGGFEWRLNPGNLLSNLDNIFDGLELPARGDHKDIISGFAVIFLKAMNSDYISDDDYEDIQALFPAAEIMKIPDSSHWVHAEKPELIPSIIRENFPA